MISKQKILLIVTSVLVVFWLLANISRVIPESKNYETYMKALNQYGNNNFTEAYYTFGNVSKFSKIKPAAIYRQALCADKLGDKKTETKKYKEIIKKYHNSPLTIRARYLKAQQLYQDKNNKKAKKEFKSILERYPKSDYAIASTYYLGSIEADKALISKGKKHVKAQQKAISYFKEYLQEAPTGRFAIGCINKWLSLNPKLQNEDNLLIARTYQANNNYASARKYLNFTNISMSWPYLVQDAYRQKNYAKVKYYTVEGLKGKGADEILINEKIDEKAENENIYKAIDAYLKVSSSPKVSLRYLLGIAKKAKGYDYLLYKNCKNMSVNTQIACYNTLYYESPKGQFAAEALSNIFYAKIKEQKYFMAKKIGRKHLADFPNSNSAPRVMFWLAKVSENTKNYEEARSYYKSLIAHYPDDYYAFHSFLNLNRYKHYEVINLNKKQIEFPYKNSDYGLITELAKVKDYGLINQLCKDDDFIQSWLDYLQGDYTSSARIARDAMDKLNNKPNRSDPRWKLVYPIHYYEEIKDSAQYWFNDPVLILAIIREESYFNPLAQSPAGAKGLMQLMPTTAREAANMSGLSLPNEKLLFDSNINIRLGNVYYSRLKSSLSSKDILAVLAYNGGIGSVTRWAQTLRYEDEDDFIEQIPYDETRNYLKKVYRSYWNYLRIYNGLKFN